MGQPLLLVMHPDIMKPHLGMNGETVPLCVTACVRRLRKYEEKGNDLEESELRPDLPTIPCEYTKWDGDVAEISTWIG